MQTKEQYEQEINKFYESWGVGNTLEQRKNFWNKKEPDTHVSTDNDAQYVAAMEYSWFLDEHPEEAQYF